MLIRITLLLITVFVWNSFSQKTYYLASNGSNNNEGSISKPWSSLNYAMNQLKDGDRLLIRAGQYHFNTSLKTKRFKKAIRIEAYPNEKVLFDGTQAFEGEWKPWENGIYVTKTNEKIHQLFTGYDYAYMARWPNASFDDNSIWRMTQSMRKLDGGFRKGKWLGKSRFGLAYDGTFNTQAGQNFHEGDSRYTDIKEMPSLAESGINFEGAIAVLNIGNWLTWPRTITEHKAGRDFFKFDTTGLKPREMKSHWAYYIYGLAALDSTNEWWFDHKNKKLYFKPNQDEKIENLNLRFKKHDFALSLTNCKNITIKNIDFFATGYNLQRSENIRFENCRFDYPSNNKLALGNFKWFAPTNNKDQKASSVFGGKNNQFINCNFIRSNAPIYFMGEKTQVVNCHFEDIEWDVLSNGGSGSIVLGEACEISHCTVTRAGNSEGIRPARTHAKITYNRLSDLGNLQHDGAGINVGTKSQFGTEVAYNWVHDSNRQGVRFDYHGTHQLRPDGEVYGDGLYHHNVTWNTQTNQVKGNRHLVLHNTIVNNNRFKDPNTSLYNMSIQGFKAMHEIEANTQTITRNNMAELSHRSWNIKPKSFTKWVKRKDGYKYPPSHVIPGVVDHNLDEKNAANKYLVNPNQWDFRPKKDSPLVDAGTLVKKEEIPSKEYHYSNDYIGDAPDIGAYEYGAAYYWIPGQQLKHASIPIPANKTNIKTHEVDLMFLGAYQSDDHLIYIGKKADKLKYKGRLKADENIINLKKLKSGQTYYWRVDAKTDQGLVSGETWSFTVE